jgi:hypothetical protein
VFDNAAAGVFEEDAFFFVHLAAVLRHVGLNRFGYRIGAGQDLVFTEAGRRMAGNALFNLYLSLNCPFGIRRSTARFPLTYMTLLSYTLTMKIRIILLSLLLVIVFLVLAGCQKRTAVIIDYQKPPKKIILVNCRRANWH